MPFGEVARSLIDGFWALMLPLIIIFGFTLGVFTPTAASVVTAIYAIFVAAVIYCELRFSELLESFSRVAQTTAIVMFLVAAAMVSAWLIAVADLPSKVVGLREPFMNHQILLMFARLWAQQWR
nr:TRAP transporter large permease subunit [Polynucleobacter necessarius]